MKKQFITDGVGHLLAPLPFPHITSAIEELDAHIRHAEQELTEKKSAVNTLCGIIGHPPRFSAQDASLLPGPRIPTLADHEDVHGKLPKDKRPSKAKKVGKSKEKAIGRTSSLPDLIVEFVTSSPNPCPAEEIAIGCVSNAPAVKYHLPKLIKAGLVQCTQSGKPGHPGLFWKPGKTKPAVKATPPPVAKESVSRAEAPGGRLARRPREEDGALVRRAIAQVPEPFTRNDLDELLPPDIGGAQIGAVLMQLRSAQEITFVEMPVGSTAPRKYNRGPEFQA